MTVTCGYVRRRELTAVDEGNGEIVLEAAIRLTQLELPKKGPHRRPEGSTWKERRAARVAALPPQLEETALFIRPDIRVGDTVRVVGRVEEWMRGGRDWVRQLAVDEGGGVCSIGELEASGTRTHTQWSSTPRKSTRTSALYALFTGTFTPSHSPCPQ
jgi:hypothetical protein